MDANSYATILEASKVKISHRRPAWKHWSTEYPAKPGEPEKLTARQAILAYLERVCDDLRHDENVNAPSLESQLDPSILAPLERPQPVDRQAALGAA